MNISLVILHADPQRGGAERYTIDLAAALRSRGHAISVLASSLGAALPMGPSYLRLASPGLSRASRYRGFLDSLDRHLAQERYDIVHAMLPVRRCDVYHPHAGLAAEALATGHLKYDCPLCRTGARLLNRVNPRRRLFAKTERHLCGTSTPPLILCLSNYVKDTVRRHYDLPDDRLFTLFNAVDLSRFDPAARPDAGRELRQKLRLSNQAIVALMIAQDFQRKGLAQSLHALAAIDDPRVQLLVVGKEDTSSYARLASRLGVRDRVVLAGPTTDPRPCYQAADFFLLPTRHDPCSLVVLESLAMGLPVISTRFNGACEIMVDGQHGFVLSDPDDIPALATAMRKLLDPALRDEMRRACLALRPVLSYDEHLNRLLQAYEIARQ